MPRQKSLKTIRAKIAALEAEADAVQNAEKRGIKQLRTVLSKYKLTAADVKLAMDGRTGRRGARGKAKPKYRNPANRTETWAGRGLRPRWLVAAMKSGKKLEDFSIKA